MAKYDGGPAFPRIDGIEEGDPGRQHVVSWGGMTLRDYFAGQAIVGLFAQASRTDAQGINSGDFPAASVAAYRIADEMLAARRDMGGD